MLVFALFAFLTGCAEPTATDETGASPDTHDTDTGSPDTGTFEGATGGTCDGYTVGAPEVAYDLIYSGSVSSDAFGDTVEGRFFDNESDWSAYLDTFTDLGSVATVDFGTHHVAIGRVRVMSTCGLNVSAVAVTQASGEPVHVDVTASDASGGCDTACSAIGDVLVAVSVQRVDSEIPTVCARRSDDGCE